MHDLEMTRLVSGVRLAPTRRSVYRLRGIFLRYLNPPEESTLVEINGGGYIARGDGASIVLG